LNPFTKNRFHCIGRSIWDVGDGDRGYRKPHVVAKNI
jgi:hypothetical protein